MRDTVREKLSYIRFFFNCIFYTLNTSRYEALFVAPQLQKHINILNNNRSSLIITATVVASCWRGNTLPSSLKVNRPIWGNSLKVSRQMVPAVRRRAMQTWSCLTNRGRVLLFSPVFLSTRQIKVCRQNAETECQMIRGYHTICCLQTSTSHSVK